LQTAEVIKQKVYFKLNRAFKIKTNLGESEQISLQFLSSFGLPRLAFLQTKPTKDWLHRLFLVLDERHHHKPGKRIPVMINLLTLLQCNVLLTRNMSSTWPMAMCS